MLRDCHVGFAAALLALACPIARADDDAEARLVSALRTLTVHVNQTAALTPEQINRQAAIIAYNAKALGEARDAIKDAFALVASYEERVGPLFMNDATRKGMPRKPERGLELHRALFAVQQGLLDHAYTPANL